MTKLFMLLFAATSWVASCDPPASESGCPDPTNVFPDGSCGTFDWDAHFEAQGFQCAEWASEAVEAGWPVAQLPKLLRTIKRESWCMPHVRSGSEFGVSPATITLIKQGKNWSGLA